MIEKDICARKHGGADTSAAAFGSTPASHREACRKRILQEIERLSVNGATCDELEAITGMQHQTCSARVTELLAERRIHFTNARRKTRSGKSARVYWLGAGDECGQLDMFGRAV